MGSGPEAKYLEYSEYLPAATPWPTKPKALGLASRIIPPLSLALLLATMVGALLFYGHARLDDDHMDAERRNALLTAVEKFGLVRHGGGDVDPTVLRLLEDFSGVKKLKWEAEPDQRGREVQSVLDGNGRIVGWLSWQAERPKTQAVLGLMPLLTAIAAGLFALAVLSFWVMRRLARELRDADAQARRLGRKDVVTGLDNSRSLLETLDEALAAREPDQIVTFMFIDLLGFRDFSDSLSRPWANELLIAVADRITAILPPGATAGRLGRHKFAVVLRDEGAAGLRFAEELAELLSRPFRIRGQGAQLTPASGLAYAPRDGLSADELIRHASLAVRAARRTGRPAVYFEPSLEADLQERRFIERELKRALEEEALDLHYQPIVSAQGSRIVGVEALLRWSHPTRGNIPPMTFVPVAEHTGMMEPLGEFVLRRALQDAKRWPALFIAVNLSPLQVGKRTLFNLLSSLLDETGVEPSRVVLEITEGVLIDDPEETRKRLQELRGLGVRLALDDFGSGYSSLSYLQHFPFDKLKIDGSFVAPLGRSENSAVIIQAIVALGRALDLSVLVEGVETEEQRVLLRLAGCDEMQGFLFAKPAPREMIDQLLLEAKLQGPHGAAQVRA